MAESLRTALHERASAVLLSVAAGVVAVAGSYALAGPTSGFVAAPIEASLSRAMPGSVVTFAIITLGDLGQDLNLLLSVGLAVVLFASLSLSALLAAETTGRASVGPVLAGLLVWLATTLVTATPVSALGAALPVTALLTLVVLVSPGSGHTYRLDPTRRTALASIGGALGFALLAGVIGSRAITDGDGDDTPANWSPGKAAATERLLSQAREQSLAVDGLEPLVSDSFYQVDINAVDPTVDRDEWTLSVTGSVDRELELDYDDLLTRESHPEFVTLRCVGDSRNGRKMDSALWEVVSLGDIIDEAGVGSEDCCVVLRAADGFYEEFPLAAARTGYIAYAMNGRTLPKGHGAPARALIPGHWGEINVKWLTEVEVLEQPVDGYWEQRGWHGTGPVNTVAKLWVTNRRGDGTVELAGHAYAGTRGISRVEVSTDGGETWADARLSAPLPGIDVWRQWVYEYDATQLGRHEVTVRAVETDGTVQPSDPAGAFPSGASGWVTDTVSP